MLVRAQGVILPHNYPYPTFDRNEPRNYQKPSLLQVDRQTRSEARGIYYGENVFYSPYAAHLIGWLTEIGEDQRMLLKQVRVPPGAHAVGTIRSQTADDFIAKIEAKLRGSDVSLKAGVIFGRAYESRFPKLDLWTNSTSRFAYAISSHSRHNAHTVRTFEVVDLDNGDVDLLPLTDNEGSGGRAS